MFKPFSAFSALASNKLLEQATTYMASGSYALTQEIYKILLKREDKPEYRHGLAQCYLQRSLLAAKKEKPIDAVRFWENYHEISQAHEANEHYLYCLVKTGQLEAVHDYLNMLDTQNLSTDHKQLAELLGFLHITTALDVTELPVQETAFKIQSQNIMLAVQALKNNTFELLTQQLSTIPYTSAYRDARTLLNYAAQLHDNTKSDVALLRKISPTSRYFAIANACAAFSLPAPALIDALIALPQQQQKLISASRHWSQRQVELFNIIIKLSEPTAKIRFKLALHFQDLLDNNSLRQFCLALLPDYPDGLEAFEQQFGKLEEFELARVSALHAEAQDQPEQALEFWQQALQQLIKQSEQNLTLAVLLKHMATLAETDDALDYLLQSLEYDPNDLDTHLQILDHYQQTYADEAYARHLQDCLVLFPDNSALMHRAMSAAVVHQDYENAIKIASNILLTDAQNSHVREILFDNLLQFARLLLLQQQFSAAQEQIKQAEAHIVNKAGLLATQILYAYSVMLQQGETQGITLLQHLSLDSNNEPFMLRFSFIHEALVLNLPIESLTATLPPLTEDMTLTDAQLQDFLICLQERHHADTALSTLKAMDNIRPAFKRAISQRTLTQEQYMQIMQCMFEISEFDLMRHYLKYQATDQNKPAWTFFKIYCNASGNPSKVNSMDISVLQLQHGLALGQDDHRTAMLISSFLDKIHLYQAEGFSSLQQDEYYDPYRNLFAHIDVDRSTKIHQRADQLRVELTEDELMDALVEMTFDPSCATLLRRTPELVDALLFVYTARMLEIEINVSVTEVIAAARQNETTTRAFSL